VLKTDLAVVGGGPAGLMAALAAAKQGANVVVFDQNPRLGGQLIKQTHRFFGSEKERAGTRGITIAQQLIAEINENPRIHVELDAAVLGRYDDGVLTFEQGDRIGKCQPRALVVATGASERMLAFPNNDLPGVYGAGAVQTLMNVHGVKPGDRVVMVGAGNIGLIVTYQLLQAGVDVAAIIEAAPRIGGYLVHAAKVRRAGVPILTQHTVTEAIGDQTLSAVTVAAVGPDWKPVAGTEQRIDCDVLCLAIGLSPLTELFWQAGCDMAYLPELGGHVPTRNERLETSVPGIFVAGDASGVEEASAAMVEGRIAGLAAAAKLGFADGVDSLLAECQADLRALRAGPAGEKIRNGLAKLAKASA
jgi:sarcosine oxidase subunit alpha